MYVAPGSPAGQQYAMVDGRKLAHASSDSDPLILISSLPSTLVSHAQHYGVAVGGSSNSVPMLGYGDVGSSEESLLKRQGSVGGGGGAAAPAISASDMVDGHINVLKPIGNELRTCLIFHSVCLGHAHIAGFHGV